MVDADPVFEGDKALQLRGGYESVAIDVHVVEPRPEIQITFRLGPGHCRVAIEVERAKEADIALRSAAGVPRRN